MGEFRLPDMVEPSLAPPRVGSVTGVCGLGPQELQAPRRHTHWQRLDVEHARTYNKWDGICFLSCKSMVQKLGSVSCVYLHHRED